MSNPSHYDQIGKSYSNYRKQDPAIRNSIMSALGSLDSVINVGAGTGSYEPEDCFVVAIEPSEEMIKQRASDSNPVIQAQSEFLPIQSNAFSAGLAVLTIHHWQDRIKGISELLRVVTEKIVITTFDPNATMDYWLVKDYFPEIAKLDLLSLPDLDEITNLVEKYSIEELPIPHDCSDGFLCSYWRRPEAYLDKDIRSAISVFSMIPNIEKGINKLREEIENGHWEQKYGYLNNQTELACGYKIITLYK